MGILHHRALRIAAESAERDKGDLHLFPASVAGGFLQLFRCSVKADLVGIDAPVHGEHESIGGLGPEQVERDAPGFSFAVRRAEDPGPAVGLLLVCRKGLRPVKTETVRQQIFLQSVRAG